MNFWDNITEGTIFVCMLSKRQKMKLINWWPPILGTGIRLTEISPDFRTFRVRMKLRWYNRNLLGIHYGGSLYSMCDPWYMFILTANLGKGYVVVDKAAAIRYIRPGKGTVYGDFTMNAEQIDEIRTELDQIGKKDYSFICCVKNMEDEVICEVEKVIYVRKKDFDWQKLTGGPGKV